MKSTSSTARVRDAVTAQPLRAVAALGLAVFALLAMAHAAGWLEVGHVVRALPDLCPYHRLTDHDCPGCGMGRSLAALAAGSPAASIAAHPFGPALALAAALAAFLPARASARVSSGAVARAAAAIVLAWWLLARVLPSA